MPKSSPNIRYQTEEKALTEGPILESREEEEKAPDTTPDDSLVKVNRRQGRGDFHSQLCSDFRPSEQPHDDGVQNPSKTA